MTITYIDFSNIHHVCNQIEDEEVHETAPRDQNVWLNRLFSEPNLQIMG